MVSLEEQGQHVVDKKDILQDFSGCLPGSASFSAIPESEDHSVCGGSRGCMQEEESGFCHDRDRQRNPGPGAYRVSVKDAKGSGHLLLLL